MNAHVLPATLTDANRPIRLRFDSRTDIPDDLLMVQHVSGSETMFGGLEYGSTHFAHFSRLSGSRLQRSNLSTPSTRR